MFVVERRPLGEGMARPSALLRAGFPYYMTLGMRRVTSNAVDIAFGKEDRLYVLCRGGLGMEIRTINWADDNVGTIGTVWQGEASPDLGHGSAH